MFLSLDLCPFSPQPLLQDRDPYATCGPASRGGRVFIRNYTDVNEERRLVEKRFREKRAKDERKRRERLLKEAKEAEAAGRGGVKDGERGQLLNYSFVA